MWCSHLNSQPILFSPTNAQDEVILGMLELFLEQEAISATALWNSCSQVTWLMPQLELEEARHRAKENLTLWRMQTLRNPQSWLSYINTKLAKSSFSSWRYKVSSNCGFPNFRGLTLIWLFKKNILFQGNPEWRK